MASWRDFPLAWAVGLAATSVLLQAEPTFYAARVAPIFDRHCVVCHGPEKKKAGLRLDSFDAILKGSESGEVIKAGDVKKSEIFRRITLPATDEDVMPSDGKPLLSKDEIKIIELWIASGATASKPLADFPDAPVPKPPRPKYVPLTPDWHPKAAEISKLEADLGVKLVPRSQIPTDGLILRTASAPARCDDAALAKIGSLAPFIVEAELARTKVSDAGLKSLAACENLRALDLTHTSVSSGGMEALLKLKKIEALNLTDTAVDDAGVEKLKQLPTLKRLWVYGSKATPIELPEKVAAH